MIVLRNGEYEDYDVSSDPQFNNIQNGLSRRKHYLGHKIGDFVIATVEYDWGIHQPVNVAKCVNCGLEKKISDLAAFRRGKGEGLSCKCGYQNEEKPHGVKYPEYVGKTLHGFFLQSYERGKGFRVECVECGKQKWASGKAVLDGTVKCSHQITAVYGDSIIGEKYGHLTVVEQVGKLFRFRCDCGFEKVLRPTDVCRGMITTCGRPECEYHRNTGVNQDTLTAKKRGFDFEKQLANVFERAGYKVTRTPDTGDYGVDLIVQILGENWAFQCKKLKVPAGVKAVTEVYGGGRFYDCTRFCVISPSGFTYQARQIAAKLGVQLETKSFHFGVKQDASAVGLLETTLTKYQCKNVVMWEIDGIVKPAQQWCDEYNISRTAVVTRVKNGMDLKTALTTPKYGGRNHITIDGITKTKQEWCDQYDISPQLYDYRTKYSGLSPIEALTKEKVR